MALAELPDLLVVRNDLLSSNASEGVILRHRDGLAPHTFSSSNRGAAV